MSSPDFRIPASRPLSSSGTSAGMRDRCALKPQNQTANHPCGWFARLSVSATVFGHRYRQALLALVVTLLMLAAPVLSVAARTPAGTLIDNIATATFRTGPTAPVTLTSNLSRIVTVEFRTPSLIEFLNYQPLATPSSQAVQIGITGHSPSGNENGPFTSLPVPPPFGGTIPFDLISPLNLNPTDLFHIGEPIFLRTTDEDQNQNINVAETIVVTISSDTGDSEVLLLTETGPDTGVFTGYIESNRDPATSNDGTLSLIEDGTLTARYHDLLDGSDVSTRAALVDPFGIVIDSITGQPQNGATVTLINAATGLPATVLGDDGISSYPATVISGAQTTDSSGRIYTPPQGGYRFPLIAPGNYRLELAPPANYLAPSTVSTAAIQNLPGAPFAIVNGSRGENFVVNPGPALHIDIPIDPIRTDLWVQKEANKDQAAVGEFLSYRLQVNNFNAAATAPGVIVSDVLPFGFSYQEGSTRIDGSAANDPDIAPDGRTLTYVLGDLPPLGNVEISYVVEVAAGTKPGEHANIASASGLGGLVSNIASAAVEIREELLRSSSLLMGRVMVGDCNQPDTALAGMEGVRIYLEDGSYAVTDDEGKYHFEGIDPGTHVVQLDQTSLPATYDVLSCEENSRFAGRNFSQFVDIQGGTMWRADFHVALKEKRRGEVGIELNSRLENNIATFQVPIQISDVPLKNLRLSIILPQGLEYIQGSSLLNDGTIADPGINGPVMTYRLEDRPAGWAGTLAIKTRIADDYPEELQTKALLTFNSPDQENQRTPMADNIIEAREQQAPINTMKFDVRPHYPTRVAEFSDEDKLFFDQLIEQLRAYEIDKLFAIGHTDNVRIAPENRVYFADNFALSAARAENVAKYLGEALNLPPEKVVSIGIADAAPVADNSTPEGRSLNRRVEVRIEGKKIDSTRLLALVKAHSGLQTVETVGLRPGEEQPTAALEIAGDVPSHMPTYDKQWVSKADDGLKWLWPEEGRTPSIPSIKVAIQHPSPLKIKLFLSGKEVSPLTYDGKTEGDANNLAVSIWRGVGVEKGDNLFEARLFDGTDKQVKTLTRLVHYSYAPAQAELVEAESTLIADGKTPSVIAIRLTDREGYPVSSGVVGEFTVVPPYAPWIDNKEEFNSFEQLKPKYQVGSDGIARITLKPSPRSGEATLLLPVEDGTAEVRAWLKPAPRDWILVGFAEGTAGYNTLSGNRVNLEEADIDNHFYEDGHIKFFAKGAIKGDWLLTMAYDSDKSDRDAESLQQMVDPDAYYPLYGDETLQGHEAASARKIYVKLERNQFYALFGDMQTDLTQTELSRYSRSLNGLKAEMQHQNFEFNLFAADTSQGFVKDEIRGDGTSGRYYLSQMDLVLNSEEIAIETRDRLQSEKIITTQVLQRHVDYDIDYADGSLFFKRPIASKDESFNPIFIIARYETKASDKTELNYGGRAAVKAFDQKIEIGATHIREKAGTAEGALFGIDATLKMDANNSLRLETATTDTEEPGIDESGQAILAEYEHTSQNLQANVYYREQEEQFGLGQQNGSESGTRKFGAEGTYRINLSTSLSALAYHEENLKSDSERDVAELSADFETDRYGIHGGFREARDTLNDGTEKQSRQILTGADWTSADHKLTLRATHEQSLGGNDENSDYPTLTVLGADYRLTRQVSLFIEQEFSWSETKETEGTRAGLKATPWTGGDVQTSLERQIDENGERIFALFGLGQTWQVTDHWSVDGSLDRSYTIKDSDSYDFDLDVPAAHGSDEDFTAISMGATYQQEEWSWENRVELRHADSQDKYGVISSLIGQVDRGISASARFSGFITDSDVSKASDQTLTLGLAYRPLDSRWIILNRLDAKLDHTETVDQDDKSWKLINNLHANYKLNRDWQIAPYYGLKYVRENFTGLHYDGFTDLFALETRYSIDKRWDLGLHGSILHSWNSDQFDYSSGASAGYLFMTNLWASLGYNFAGFRDEDFSQSNYTAKGVYLKFRLKFDQNTLEEALEWLNRQ